MKLKMKERRAYVDTDEPVGLDLSELRAKLQIDKHNLDEECIQQPSLYQTLSEQHVLAVSVRDTLKEEMQIEDAVLAEEIRKRLTSTPGERSSETRIGDLVQQEQRHIAKQRKWAAAVTRAATLGAMVTAADQRGKMLRELAQLYVAGYYDRVVASSGRRTTDAAVAIVAREGMRKLRTPRA